jgi:hypothetical protein
MKSSVLLLSLVSAICPALLSIPANAQATRTWVSGVSVGGDNGSCSRTAPCSTFAYAISVTAAGGQINCLDPGGFGALTISKSISIICGTNGEAGVLASSGNGITISAGSTDIVYLSGLDFEGLSTGFYGVEITGALRVTLQNCVIQGFLHGIDALQSNSMTLEIKDTTVIYNSEGVVIGPNGGATVYASIDHSLIQNNTGDGSSPAVSPARSC